MIDPALQYLVRYLNETDESIRIQVFTSGESIGGEAISLAAYVRGMDQTSPVIAAVTNVLTDDVEQPAYLHMRRARVLAGDDPFYVRIALASVVAWAIQADPAPSAPSV